MTHGFFNKALWKRPLVAWYLYDLANSFVAITATAYFSQWIVIDNGYTDLWYGAPIMLATLFLVFVSPYVGSLADKYGYHYRIFAGYLCGTILAKPVAIYSSLLFFWLYYCTYLIAQVSYNAYLKQLADPSLYGRVSGLGFAFSQIGNVGGLLLALLTINGSFVLFGGDRLATLMPAAIVFVLIAIPSLYTFKQSVYRSVNPNVIVPSLYNAFWHNLAYARTYAGVLPLLLSFYFFSDAILTLYTYGAIYMEKVFGISDIEKTKVLLFVLLGFIAGALIGGYLSDRINSKRLLISTLGINAALTFFIAFNNITGLVIVLFALYGISMGVMYASSRSYLSALIPKEESGTFFGLYVFAERIASVMGPAVWGITIWALNDMEPTNYRFAAAGMGVFVVISIVPLLYMRPRSLNTKSIQTENVEVLRFTKES